MNVLYCWEVPHPGSEDPMIKIKRTPSCCIYIVLNIQSIYLQPPKTQYLNGMTLKTVRGGSGHICVCLCGDTVSVMNNSLRPVVLVVAPGCGCDRL